MRKRRLGGVAVAVAVAAVALTAVAAFSAIETSAVRPTRGFTIKGHVRGLLPGASRRLVITVHNRLGRTLLVRSISTRVRDANPKCRGKNVRVLRFRGRLRLRGHASRRVAVRASMRKDSPSACQGAAFRLVFSGRATRG
jgi:hypothetical protein